MQEAPVTPTQGAPLTPEQEREALVTDELASGDIAFKGIPGVQHSHYLIRPEDESSWFPAWELRVDRFGTEYGVPKRLPKGQAEYYLAKRRPADGGKRFTAFPPANILPEPPFECFVGDCRKRVRERVHLIRHVEVCHAQEAPAYKPFLDEIRQAVISDNPKLAEVVRGIAATPDEPVRAVSARRQVAGPVGAVPPGHAHCDDCGWTSPKPKKNIPLSLQSHQRSCSARKEE